MACKNVVVVDGSRSEDTGEESRAVAMKRSESELILEKFLAISSSSSINHDDKGVSSSSSPGNLNVEEQTKADYYKLSISKLPGSATAIHLPGCLDSGITGTPLSPCKPKSSDTHIWTATSDSSRDLSDDEDVDTEVGPCEQSMIPVEVKRIRRMVSNRESARRSRKRKQAHLADLETQVDHLRSENSTLCKQLTDITQQCDRAATHNKILKSDMEVLRASVKMAQDMVTTGPLSDIVNHHSLRSDFASSFRSLCRPLDIPTFVGNDGFLGISSLPDMPPIGVETEILDVKAKLESHVNIEHLEAWNWDVSAPMKHI